MSFTVIIASAGRPTILGETLESVLALDPPPGEIIVSVPGPEHLPPAPDPRVRIVSGTRGLTAQLNAALASAKSSFPYVAVFDDDVEIAPDYLAKALRILETNSDAALFGGKVIHEGEMSRVAARNLLASGSQDGRLVTGAASVYGCNFVFRRFVWETVKFDENLPLYSWLFDLAFCREVSRVGKVGWSSSCRIVHLRAATGRIGAEKFGYSQISNPWYLKNKGLMGWGEMLVSFWLQGVLANAGRTLIPSERSWRLRRLHGNFQALRDLMLGQCRPRKIEEI